MQKYLAQYWGLISIDNEKVIRYVNERAVTLFGSAVEERQKVTEVLPWLEEKWLTSNFLPRVVVNWAGDELLLDIVDDEENKGYFHLFFRKTTDYQNISNVVSRLSNATLDLQAFIDVSYDGIVISDGTGIIVNVNKSFLHISGLRQDQIVGKHFSGLVKKGTISYSVAEQAIQQRKAASAIITYPSGKEAMITSTPFFDEHGKIIRVISNARDITELNALHKELKNTKDLIKEFQQKLKTINISSKDLGISITRSPSMERFYELAAKVARTDLQLLITGESGVGKTTLAKYIHLISERSNAGSFIHINCSSIPESLLESELFGYEEGAFTGAKKSKAGLFEMANKGTLFLDEIGDMSVPLQAKLLNVLQEKKFYRVGGTKEISVDVRLIAATNTELENLIGKGLFRKDLYYRLNVIPIRIPSLAERKDDLPLLISSFLEQSNERHKVKKSISHEVMEVFLKYDWPGNIRELINFIERLVIIVDEPVIELRHIKELLPVEGLIKEVAQNTDTQEVGNKLWCPGSTLKDVMQKLEKQIIEEAISECGSFKEASQVLGVDVATLFRKRKNNRNSLSL